MNKKKAKSTNKKKKHPQQPKINKSDTLRALTLFCDGYAAAIEPTFYNVDVQTSKWTLIDKSFLSTISNVELKTIAITQNSQATLKATGSYIERMFEVLPVGVYPILFETTDSFGFVGYGEAEVIHLDGLLTATGNLKLLIKESAIVARNYLTTFVKQFNLGDASNLHFFVHIIPGSFSKDGGSGGAGLVTCMLSRFLELAPLNAITYYLYIRDRKQKKHPPLPKKHPHCRSFEKMVVVEVQD
ncbi:unnamed protein product [Meloidogyne enterolobii]|uniref:Uncharacterized protein n=1 Tax=Meloidogyne enterolobii TaxID=390850 RepID=A0ACB1A8F4_MELEN